MERFDVDYVFSLLTGLSSLVIRFYVIRSTSLPGLRRAAATILLGVGLFYTALNISTAMAALLVCPVMGLDSGERPMLLSAPELE